MPLYQVVAIQKEKVKDEEVIDEEKLIVGVMDILAHDPQAAMIRFVLDHKTEIENTDQKRLEVSVRPF